MRPSYFLRTKCISHYEIYIKKKNTLTEQMAEEDCTMLLLDRIGIRLMAQ